MTRAELKRAERVKRSKSKYAKLKREQAQKPGGKLYFQNYNRKGKLCLIG